jgi:hypothetical protein
MTQVKLKSKPKTPPVALVQAMMNVTTSLQSFRTKMMPPQVAMVEMINAYQVSQAICVAAQLGIADLLKDGVKSSEELAQLTGVDRQSLYRLLRSLASFGVFAEYGNEYFGLTPLAATLQTDSPDSVRAWAIMSGEKWHWELWGNLIESVKTGKTAVEYTFGKPNIFEYFVQDSQAGDHFDQAMTNLASLNNSAIATGYDFSGISKLVDVGGGYGSHLTTILKSYPSIKGVLFDQPSVIAGAKEFIAENGLAQRCELVAGDFFQSVPAGGDAYLLKTVIHDWDDDRAIQILKHCRRAMVNHSKLLLVEAVIPPGNTPYFGKLLDLEMLTTSGGRERTEEEYRTLFTAAGFKLTKVFATASPWKVIEAVGVS